MVGKGVESFGQEPSLLGAGQRVGFRRAMRKAVESAMRMVEGSARSMGLEVMG